MNNNNNKLSDRRFINYNDNYNNKISNVVESKNIMCNSNTIGKLPKTLNKNIVTNNNFRNNMSSYKNIDTLNHNNYEFLNRIESISTRQAKNKIKY